MRTFAKNFVKYIVSYVAVLFAIMLLPVFLLVQDVSVFDQIIDYLFNNNNV